MICHALHKLEMLFFTDLLRCDASLLPTSKVFRIDLAGSVDKVLIFCSLIPHLLQASKEALRLKKANVFAPAQCHRTANGEAAGISWVLS